MVRERQTYIDATHLKIYYFYIHRKEIFVPRASYSIIKKKREEGKMERGKERKREKE